MEEICFICPAPGGIHGLEERLNYFRALEDTGQLKIIAAQTCFSPELTFCDEIKKYIEKYYQQKEDDGSSTIHAILVKMDKNLIEKIKDFLNKYNFTYFQSAEQE